ncbi:DnaJ subfamily B member 12 [Spatholobus suberectus]|nr:DnaJ subfamily B member 12 [Spatholobus suberectus]
MRRETDGDDNGTRGGSESAPDSLLRPCLSLLTRRDFTACGDSARRVPRSDPNVSLQLDQILAVADVLAAAERRRGPGRHLDWYSILRLRPAAAADRDLARQQFKALVRLLDPNKNKLPLADEALMRVREAWCVLSDPARKARFDREIRDAAAASFWTMCPYCWYLHEYERRYEECTLRCANCLRTFHGAVVTPPPPESVVPGKEEYYCYHVSLPLRYPVGERCRFGDGANDGRKRLRVKTVANRVKMKGFVDGNGDSDLD